MNEYLDLFLTFMRIGGLTFGGGYAMLPMLKKEVVDSKKWCSEEELMDYFAIGQCTPGVIAVNTATFIGTKIKGVFGGIIATLGVVFPSLVIISLVAGVLQGVMDLEAVGHAFAGLRVCVCALIASAVFKLSKKSIVDIYTTIIFICCLIAHFFFGVSPIYLVVISALIGIVLKVVISK